METQEQIRNSDVNLNMGEQVNRQQQRRRLLIQTGFSRSKKFQCVNQTINVILIAIMLLLSVPIKEKPYDLQKWIVILMVDKSVSIIILLYALYLSSTNISECQKKIDGLNSDPSVDRALIERRKTYLAMKRKSDEIWLQDRQQDSLYCPVLVNDLLYWISFICGAYISISQGD